VSLPHQQLSSESPPPTDGAVDLVIVGAGAAGLFAAIWAGRGGPAQDRPTPQRIVLVDGAATLGAKILVAGGGRCNVTHHAVDERDFAGGSRAAIRQVLRHFSVEKTIEFFESQGVTLKREETGKLFPTTDKARTVLDALLSAARGSGVTILHPWRVATIERDVDGAAFVVTSTSGETLHATRLILATGGLSLPKTGSDGHGHRLVQSLGHSITPRVFPALVPLILESGHPLLAVSGVSAVARLDVALGSGKRVASCTDSLLCTHFGLSGPAALDISRWWSAARSDDPQARLTINWVPQESADSMDRLLLAAPTAAPPRLTPSAFLRGRLPERLAEALCAVAGVDPHASLRQLSREVRRDLSRALCELVVPVTGDRGFGHAEVTAGGVPLSEVHLATLESRLCPGLFLCGEILDVDGRIGGFNFQWAWASGFTAGVAGSAGWVVGCADS